MVGQGKGGSQEMSGWKGQGSSLPPGNHKENVAAEIHYWLLWQTQQFDVTIISKVNSIYII